MSPRTFLTRWFFDNPVLRMEIRRWERRPTLMRSLAVSAGVSAAIYLILVFGNLALNMWFRVPMLGQPTGAVAFSIIAGVHLLIQINSGKTCFPLLAEAAAERLEFLRLTALTPRELLGMVAAARLVLSSYTLLAPAPIYLALMLYGRISPLDVVGLYLLLLLASTGFPTPMESTVALAHRVGSGTADLSTKALQAKGKQANPFWMFWGVGQGILPQFIRPVWGALSKLIHAVSLLTGSALTTLLPLTLLPITGRLLVEPLPFFGARITPALPVIALWLAAQYRRWFNSSELWFREAVSMKLPGRGEATVLPEDTGRTGEQAVNRVMETVIASLVGFLTLGYIWAPLIESGLLGRFAGGSDTLAGLTVFLVLVSGARILVQYERLRLGVTGEHTRPLWGLFPLLALALGPPSVSVLMAAMAGGESNLGPLVSTVGALGCVGLGAMIAGRAWGQLSASSLNWAPRQVGVLTGGWVVWTVGGYLVPLILLRTGLQAEWMHYAVSWSPFYALLAQLQGVLKVPAGVRSEVLLIAPAIAGVLLQLPQGRFKASSSQIRNERSQPDRLESWLVNALGRFDNPFTNQRLHRRLRKPYGMLFQAVGTLLVWMLMIVTGLQVITMISARNGLASPGAWFFAWGWLKVTWGVWAVLAVAAISAFSSLMLLSIHLSTTITAEAQLSKVQGRRTELFRTPVTPQAVVQGLIVGEAITPLPTYLALTLISFSAAMVAMLAGAPIWALPVWLLVQLQILALGILSGLGGIQGWEPRPWTVVLVFVFTVGLCVVFAVLGPVAVAFLTAVGRALIAVWPIVVAALFASTLIQIPLAYRKALKIVRRCGLPENLEKEGGK